MKAVGAVMLLLMFRHSVICLAYYDEEGDRLQRRKEPILLIYIRCVIDVCNNMHYIVIWSYLDYRL